jgi:NAD+ synthase
VRCLAKQLKIPQAIIDKAPTAGLWPGQTDEAEMGISYAELDDILARVEQGRKQLYPAAKVAKVKRMKAASAHKRSGAAICEF